MLDTLIARLEELGSESSTPIRIESDPAAGAHVIRLSSDRNPASAPVVIDMGRDDLVSLTIGEAGHLELYGEPSDTGLTAEIIAWVRAVLRGGFTETIFWRDNELAKSELRIVVEGSEQKVKYYKGILTLLPYRNLRKEQRTYEAY